MLVFMTHLLNLNRHDRIPDDSEGCDKELLLVPHLTHSQLHAWQLL
jgi:hypothetical protein